MTNLHNTLGTFVSIFLTLLHLHYFWHVSESAFKLKVIIRSTCLYLFYTGNSKNKTVMYKNTSETWQRAAVLQYLSKQISFSVHHNEMEAYLCPFNHFSCILSHTLKKVHFNNLKIHINRNFVWNINASIICTHKYFTPLKLM